MTFLEKLDFMMRSLSLNKNKLSQISGVPYTTIDSLYKKGYENVQMSTIKKIANALGVSLDYLVMDEISDTSSDTLIPNLTAQELSLVNSYRSLNDEGKDYILQTMDLVTMKYKKEPASKTV